MNRRSVLLGAGTVLSLGLGTRLRRGPGRRISVKLWLTAEAAAYPNCRIRAVEYLRQAVHPTGKELDLTLGEPPQRFPSTDRSVEHTDWPMRVLAGRAGLNSLEPVADVNLLLTDGQVTGPNAGYAYGNIAAVPGARFLAKMPPYESGQSVFDYSAPAAVTQLLLHEVGHTLGLDHGHGMISTNGSAVTVTPMISGYAWAGDRPRHHGSGCGKQSISVEGMERRLSMRYSRCAESVIQSHRVGIRL